MIFASPSCTFDCLVCRRRNISWTEVQLLPSINRSGVLSAISALWKRTRVGASEQVRRTPVDHRNKRQEGTGGGAVTRVALVCQLVKTHLGSGFVPSRQPKIRYRTLGFTSRCVAVP